MHTRFFLICALSWGSLVPLVVAQPPTKSNSNGKASGNLKVGEPARSSTDSTLDTQTQTVVAEGVGTNADEALKDAFRNAVRQVVGAVVDAETQVKNDELISDKVLTYSDGFIKKYDEIDQKVSGGLYKIRIKATVERKDLLAKLRSANVVMKAVDGNQLFAQTVSKLESDKDAVAIIEKQFEGFPQSLIKASIVGEPKVSSKSETTATVGVIVQLEPDTVAYKDFSKRLRSVLDKMTKVRDEFAIDFSYSGKRGDRSPLLPDRETIGEWFGTSTAVDVFSYCRKAVQPSDGRPNKDSLILAVATNRTKAGDKMDFSYYRLTSAIAPSLLKIDKREGTLSIALVRDNADVISKNRFPLKQGFLRPYIEENSGFSEQFFLLGPTFFRPLRRGLTISHTTVFQLPVEFEVNLDDLKELKDVKAEIIFDE